MVHQRKGVARRIELVLRELYGSKCAFETLLLVRRRGARAQNGAVGLGIMNIERADHGSRRQRGPDVTNDTSRVETPTNTSSLKPDTVIYKRKSI